MILAVLSVIGRILLWILLILLGLILYFLIFPMPFRLQFDLEPDFQNPSFMIDLRGFLRFFRLGFVEGAFYLSLFWGRLVLFPKKKEISDQDASDALKAKSENQKRAEEYQKRDQGSIPSDHKEEESSHSSEGKKPKSKSSKKSGRKKKGPKKTDWKGFLSKPETSDGIMYILLSLGKWMNRLGINLGGTDFSYSLGRPDKTGMSLGTLAMLPIFHGKDILIRPDFSSEEAFYFGRLALRGRLILLLLLILVVQLMINKDSRFVITYLLKQL